VSDLPGRGDYVHLNFDPKAGHEQGGPRYALVLSHSSYNKASGMAIVVPITGQKKGYPFEVQIPEGERFYGVVLADHTKSIDWRARHVEVVGHASEELLEDVVARYLPLITP
jgi:mRNA interferase MazF